MSYSVGFAVLSLVCRDRPGWPEIARETPESIRNWRHRFFHFFLLEVEVGDGGSDGGGEG